MSQSLMISSTHKLSSFGCLRASFFIMKKYKSYLIYLIPITLIILLQNAQNHTVSTTFEISGETVIYQLKGNELEKMQLNKLNNLVQSVTNKKKLLKFLDNYLEKSKRFNSSKYVGFAMSAFSSINVELKLDQEVQLKHAELLEYSHQFDDALLILQKVSVHPVFRHQAHLRMMNIHGLRGDMDESETFCKLLRSSNFWKVSTLCKLWIDGIKYNNSQSIEKLISFEKTLHNDTELKQWLYQLLIDLLLKQNNLQDAVDYLSKLEALNNIDKSALIQLVDFAIITENITQAEIMLEKFDSDNQLKFRKIIITKILKENFVVSQQINENIEVLKSIQENSQYRLISMWEYYINNDKNSALEYSNLNTQIYKTQNDLLLQSYLLRK